MKIERLIVWLTALFFLVYGALFLLLPSAMALAVTGSSPITTSGLIDMRATYGGMSIAVALLLFLLARNTATVKIALLAVIIVLLSMAFTRLIGIIVDGNANQLMYVYLLAELVPSVFASALYLRGRESS